MRNLSNDSQVELHPISGHRNPAELALDAAGAIGRPDLDVIRRGATPLVMCRLKLDEIEKGDDLLGQRGSELKVAIEP